MQPSCSQLWEHVWRQQVGQLQLGVVLAQTRVQMTAMVSEVLTVQVWGWQSEPLLGQSWVWV